MEMQVTFFSFGMTVVWSSLLIVIIYLCRKNYLSIRFFSISGLLLLYLFCIIRMALPFEFPFSRIIISERVLSGVIRLLGFEIWQGRNGFSIGALLAGIWAIITILLLLRLACQYYKSIVEIRNLDKRKDSKLQTIIEKVASDSGKHIRLEVFASTAVKVPMSVGIFKRFILLPDREYGTQKAYYILMHEYTHLINGDLAVKLLISVMCCIYWWNPFVHLLQKDLEQTLEIKCDLTVTDGMRREEKADYLAAIVLAIKDAERIRLHENEGRGVSVDSIYLFSETSMNVKERFEIVSKQGKKFKKSKANAVVSCLLLIILLFSYAFVIQSSFEVPLSEIEVTEDTYEINLSEDYIIRDTAGIYTIIMSNGKTKIIDEDVAQKMQDIGFEILEVE